jgi:uncharacterized membrane protein
MSNKEFPKDRVFNFTDAIFAIAITLLILDVKVPVSGMIDKFGVMTSLFYYQLSQLIGFVVSFFVAALFWRVHLTLARHISTYDSRLLSLNTLSLFFVVIMPFSTSLYSGYFGNNNAFFIYCVNLIGLGLMNYFMTRYVIKKENLDKVFTILELKWMKLRSLLVPIVFLLSIGFTLISPILGRISFVLIFIFIITGEIVVKRKMKKLDQASS